LGLGEERKKKKEETTGQKYNVRIFYAGGHKYGSNGSCLIMIQCDNELYNLERSQHCTQLLAGQQQAAASRRLQQRPKTPQQSLRRRQVLCRPVVRRIGESVRPESGTPLSTEKLSAY